MFRFEIYRYSQPEGACYYNRAKILSTLGARKQCLFAAAELDGSQGLCNPLSVILQVVLQTIVDLIIR